MSDRRGRRGRIAWSRFGSGAGALREMVPQEHQPIVAPIDPVIDEECGNAEGAALVRFAGGVAQPGSCGRVAKGQFESFHIASARNAEEYLDHGVIRHRA